MHNSTGSGQVARLPVLDGVRGLATVIVMAFHFTLQLQNSTDPASAVLTGLFGVGWSGVDLFFVLSGFLITGLLVDAKGSSNYYRVFYARRMFRILPLYYLVLAMLFFGPFVFQGHGERLITPLHDQAFYWLYLQNFHRLPEPFGRLGGHLWTLAIEEQFYLVWPVVIGLLAPKNARRACVVCIVTSIVWRAVGTFGPWQMETSHVTPASLDGLAIGSAIALIARRPHGLERLWRVAPAVAIVAASVLVVYTTLPAATAALFPLRSTCVALIYASVLLYGLTAPKSFLLDSRLLQTTGRFSYGLYIVHVPLITVAYVLGITPASIGVRLGSFGGLVAYSILMFLLSFAVAWLSWHLFEKRFLRFKRHFIYNRTSTVEATVGPHGIQLGKRIE